MVKRIVSISATCLVILVGCGGGSSDEPSGDSSTASENTGSGEGDNTDNTTVLTGIFVDSEVEGVSYSTATRSGTTNSAGEFTYLEGEQVTFSIGATEMPAAVAAPQVSPVEMAVGSSNPTDTITNIARLLQSLDVDSNPDNGISISSDAAANAAVIDFDVSADEFANDPAVINLVANSGSTTTTLISEIDAISHLESELNTEISSVNNDTQAGPKFTQDMLLSRTLVPYPIDQALQPHSYTRFDSTSSAMVVGTPGGVLSAGGFPWSLDANNLVVIDFDSFEAGALFTLELQSVDGTTLTTLPVWKGEADPILKYTLSVPLTTAQISGKRFNVQSAGGTGSIEFRLDGQFELSNSRGELQVGDYANHPVDGITIGDVPTSYSEIVLASGSIENGILMKSDFGDSGIFRVEFFEVTGNTWTALHTVSR